MDHTGSGIQAGFPCMDHSTLDLGSRLVFHAWITLGLGSRLVFHAWITVHWIWDPGWLSMHGSQYTGSGIQAGFPCMDHSTLDLGSRLVFHAWITVHWIWDPGWFFMHGSHWIWDPGWLSMHRIRSGLVFHSWINHNDRNVISYLASFIGPKHLLRIMQLHGQKIRS